MSFLILQLAGVQCAGNPHFWVNEDGSYQEEGQKNTKGYIWGKVWFLLDLFWILSFLLGNKIITHFFFFIISISFHPTLLMLLFTIQAGTKLLCAVLSLPVPSKSSNPCGEQISSSISRSMPDYLEQRVIQKLLLIGYNGSGTSTIFKQVALKILPIFVAL